MRHALLRSSSIQISQQLLLKTDFLPKPGIEVFRRFWQHQNPSSLNMEDSARNISYTYLNKNGIKWIEVFPEMESGLSYKTISLIENVRKRAFLYNQDSPLYRDAEMRTRAWEEIGEELNVRADEAKVTWDKLRRCFSNALNRRRQFTSRVRKTWRYHKQMQFLEPHVDWKKNPQASVEDFLEVNLKEDSVADGEEFGITTVDPLVIKEEPRDDMDEVLASFVDTEEAHPVKRALEVSDIAATAPIRKKKNRGFDYVDIDEPVNVQYPFRNAEITMQRPSHSQTSFSPWNMDETDMFFLSMARMTKKLTLLQQAQIKSRLSHEVLEAVIEKEENSIMEAAQPKKHYFTKLQKVMLSTPPSVKTEEKG